MSKRAGIIAIFLSVLSLCCSLTCVWTLTSRNVRAGQGSSVQYVMYIGTNDKDSYQPKYSREQARDIVDLICLNYFDGYTLQEATGSWKDEKDNITHEYTLVCYFDGADEETVYKAADEVIKALNQNTILIERNEIHMEYYSGRGR